MIVNALKESQDKLFNSKDFPELIQIAEKILKEELNENKQRSKRT